jgi:hypothetical protein
LIVLPKALLAVPKHRLLRSWLDHESLRDLVAQG